jgi:hypothetical protein
MIKKGTIVRIKTTNGGDIVARLDQNYRRTYDAVIESGNGYTIILADRITSVEATVLASIKLEAQGSQP